MAIGADSEWRIRTDGDDTNGGGWDGTISGAGTDYTDQAAAQLTLTDLATSGAGSTTLTSATGGFTSAMIGNCIRIDAGTNFDDGYYFITAHTDTNTVTVDRTPTSGGAGSSGEGKLGGAFAGLKNVSTGGTAPAPAISSPVVAGNKVHVRGSGSEDPSAADYTQSGYYTFLDPDPTGGVCRFIGYNGKPLPQHTGGTLVFHSIANWHIQNFAFKADGTTNRQDGFIQGQVNKGNIISNCIFDANGVDCIGIKLGQHMWHNTFRNTGSDPATSLYAAIEFPENPYGSVWFCRIDDWYGGGIHTNTGAEMIASLCFNQIEGCNKSGISLEYGLQHFGVVVAFNTINNNDNDGLVISLDDSLNYLIHNNIITNNGGVGIKNSWPGSDAEGDRYHWANNNNVWNNTGGNYENRTADDSDLSVDPDFQSGTVIPQEATLKEAANAVQIGAVGASNTNTYMDIGCAQLENSGGGGRVGGKYRLGRRG